LTWRSATSRPGLASVSLVLALLATAHPAPIQAADPTVVSHGTRDRPWIALTFDDGVSPANCRRILAILVDEQVPATFFPLAEAMPLDPDFWRLVVRSGDPVGDHTMSHPQMPGLRGVAQLRQIRAARTLGESILGRPMLRVFRPPYGAYDARTVAAARKAGFDTLLLWDVSDRDTSPRGSLAKMLAAGRRGTDGSVVLMHCGPNATPYLLRPLIESYRARGFEFVTIPKLLGLPWTSGPVIPPSVTEILDGLSPLPPTSSGGVITGPNGYVPVSPAEPVPSSAPSAVPLPPTAARSPSAVPALTGSVPGTTPEPSNPATAVPSDVPHDPGDGGRSLALAAALLGVAVAAGGLAFVLRRRRRRPEV